jgi:raffinose/stachyose/melibiose transport system substrate-binding protein
MKKKLLALGLTAVMSISLLAGCGGGDSTTTSTTKGSDSGAETTTTAAPEETTGGADGSVYYLNFKPEQDGQWQELAELYTEETGIEVKVITAASGQYETSLMSEMGKSEAPTLFQVNGPVGLANWKDIVMTCPDQKWRENCQTLPSL